MPSVLVVGATRGLGFEIAKQYSEQSFTTYATARSSLPKDAPKGISWIKDVDVAEASAGKAIEVGLKGECPDVIVITAGLFPKEEFDQPNIDDEVNTYKIVAIGPVVVVTALHKAGLLKKGSKIILVSSEAGSITLRHESIDKKGGNYAHHASKAAQNMVGKLLSIDLKDEGIAVGLVHPGFMRTEMTKNAGLDAHWDDGGAVTPAESARSLIQWIETFDISKTGEFWAPRGPAATLLLSSGYHDYSSFTRYPPIDRASTDVMATVSLLNVAVQNNPAAFTDPYEFEITFECLEPLQKDLEWKLTYVGSATSSEHDQELDSLLVGPVPVGTNKFIFQADPPNISRIPTTDIVGVTVILLSCSYDNREFVRVGYYVNNEYNDEALINDPPAKPVIEKVRRNILAEKPRVTRLAIKWDSEESAPALFPPDQPDVDAAEDDGANYGAEEEEEEEEEAEATEGDAVKAGADGEDAEMAGVEDAKIEEDDEAGSEDIEDESEDDEEDDLEEEEAEGETNGADDMEMEDGAANNEHADAHQQDVMVH
ncbi:hypothetical protein AMS68_006027 [Peltaster fructicola]|uniref:Anti-silencing function protein 1 n=1 Tax=Peltaster fructicola TaxID=286661 RepID=A0A6H0Y1H9_9PEZI|nr:hypothetical protein AMS68_006027 [Peltaster fructicola]